MTIHDPRLAERLAESPPPPPFTGPQLADLAVAIRKALERKRARESAPVEAS